MFSGNKDSSNVITNVLEPPISRLVVLRILPKSVNGDILDGHVCLQLEIIGCNANPVSNLKNNAGKSENQLYDRKLSITEM